MLCLFVSMDDSNKKVKLPKAAKEAKIKKETEPKKPRSAAFTVIETDLLLGLIVASDLNTMVTNKMTPYGRLKNWQDIHRAYNAAANVNVCIFDIYYYVLLY